MVDLMSGGVEATMFILEVFFNVNFCEFDLYFLNLPFF